MMALKERKYPAVEKPKPFRQDAAYLRLKRLANNLEKTTGDGKEIGGTGLTRLKLKNSPVAGLFDAGKISQDELRAVEDIETAWRAISGEVMLKGQSYERRDKSNTNFEPYAVVDAVSRYKAWSKFWSARKHRGDLTLEIVWAVIIDEYPIRKYEREVLHCRNGFVSQVVCTALRDYLARAGWADPRQAKAWMEAAEANFTLRKPVESSPNAA